ncbi:hypothetical protein ATDW_14550 [Asticcacaulis sp. DW145]|uniref:Uncharacterized protein n=1 Tax=Asticcacaulis currens TaxID=2984210 RepID=A0ABT5IEB7_9CAUL|nr:hypothetical protein [Asticcacaulis currens]MDC7694534.1 hypothetical protein [Asticcacaulis currens]BEV10959.1 hypothetical protein ATDW_14550 [Asticcacaulis sp. DW145]
MFAPATRRGAFSASRTQQGLSSPPKALNQMKTGSTGAFQMLAIGIFAGFIAFYMIVNYIDFGRID